MYLRVFCVCEKISIRTKAVGCESIKSRIYEKHQTNANFWRMSWSGNSLILAAIFSFNTFPDRVCGLFSVYRLSSRFLQVFLSFFQILFSETHSFSALSSLFSSDIRLLLLSFLHYRRNDVARGRWHLGDNQTANTLTSALPLMEIGGNDGRNLCSRE